MKGKEKNYQKGITLIALVITIVVLLILAGVTLSIVFNGGIIDKSQQAVDTYSEESAKEKLSLALFDYKMAYITGGEKDLVKYIDDNKVGKVTGGEGSKDTEYIIEVDGYEFIVKKEKLEIISNGPAKTPKIANGNNLNGNTNGTLTGLTYKYYNPVIPVGFKILETTDASWEDADGDGKIDGWNNGLVITDAENNGNEFVWVPVDGITVDYNRKLFSKNYTDITNSGINSLSDDISAIPVNDETAQITKYEGFYIARYEAGKPNSGTVPLSKYNQTAWVNVTYNNANTYAKSYKTGNSYVLSGLVTGRMWDATMKWIAVTDGLDAVQTNSGSWGIYSGDGGPFKTGAATVKDIKKKNIYDLAGNLTEWTAEIYSSSKRVSRGGDYYVYSSNCPAAYRSLGNTTYSGWTYSFRFALYIM